MKRRRHVSASFFRVGYGAGGRALDLGEEHNTTPDTVDVGPIAGDDFDTPDTLTLDQNQRLPHHEGARTTPPPPNAAYAILDRVAPGATFGTGGCWLFARALQHVRGGELFALESENNPVEHVLLKIGGRFVDVDGSWTSGQLARRFGGMCLVPLTNQPLGEIPADESAALELADVLRGGTEHDAERGFNLKELDRGRVQGPMGPYNDWANTYSDDNTSEGGFGIHMGRTASVGAEDLPRNADGTVTLYHGTTREAAEQILATGMLQSAGEPDVYLTTAPSGTGYGDGTVVAVDVDPELLSLDDEFPDGRKDFRLSAPGKRVRIRNPRIAAGVPAVGRSARELAGTIARSIEGLQADAGIRPLKTDERRYLWDKEIVDKAKAAMRQLISAHNPSAPRLVDLLPRELVKTEQAWQTLQRTRIYLGDEDAMRGTAGYLNPQTGHIWLRVSSDHMLSPLHENLVAFEKTLVHEFRHALDWAYTGRGFERKRHPGKQNELLTQTRDWWIAYLSNPTELMAWAGNVAYKLDHRPRGWVDLKEQLAAVTVPVLEKGTHTAQVEMRDPGGAERVVDVPILELIPSDQRPRFLSMVLKAYDALDPVGGGAGVNPWHVRREDVVNRKKIPAEFIPKLLEVAFLYQKRDRMADEDDWQSWVKNRSSSQLEMEIENNYDAYQLLSRLPKNQLGEYPDLEDMIERWRTSGGVPYDPEPVEEEPAWDWARSQERAREHGFGAYAQRRQPTVAVDLDGTIVEEQPGWAAKGVIGEPLPGAMKALRELESLGWKILIHTARFAFPGDHARLKQTIEQHLRARGVPFHEVVTGPKPPADYYVDNRAVSFSGNWDQTLAVLTGTGVTPPSNPDEQGDERDEQEAGTGLVDWVETENDFGSDGMGTRRDRSLVRSPEKEEALF